MAERTEHLEAVLLSAVRPSQEQEKRFLAFLAEKYGEGTTLTWQKSDDYPDGFRLEVGAEVYDWSAGGRLSQFKDALEKLAATQGDVIPPAEELPAQTLASSSKRMQPTLSSDKSCTMPRRPPDRQDRYRPRHHRQPEGQGCHLHLCRHRTEGELRRPAQEDAGNARRDGLYDHRQRHGERSRAVTVHCALRGLRHGRILYE